jgi:hypothetical protein
MKTIWTGRMVQASAKYGEHAPVATTACCNACRTSVQANLLTMALGVVTAAGAAVARRLERRQ